MHLMLELGKRSIPFRNEQQIQDLSVEPAAKLIVDYLSCVFGQREPKAWIRLMNQLLPFADEEVQSDSQRSLQQFMKEQRKRIAVNSLVENPADRWWEYSCDFLAQIGSDTLIGLSPDYESRLRLEEVLLATKARIEETLMIEPELNKALLRFSDDQAVRILTIHKSKGLEFDSVIILAIENEIFFGDQAENRCAFFVGASRAKRRLVLTYADERDRPIGYSKYWSTVRSPQSEYLDYADAFCAK